MKVTEIQRFCMHDGPGIRSTVFFKGCPLRCAWCHNPETQSSRQEILFYQKRCIGCGACEAVCPSKAHKLSGNVHCFDRSLCTGCLRCTTVCCAKALEPSLKNMTAKEILTVVEKDRAFYGQDGGMTLSGGEPMMQPTEALDLLYQCKRRGIGTAIETSGYFNPNLLPDFIPLTDCFLWDFKDSNEERHKQYTGVSNMRIKNNLLLADSLGATTVLRCIMIHNVNMQEEHYRAISELWHQLKHCRYVECIPYHMYGGSKMLLLGKEDNGKRDWCPTQAMLEEAKSFLINQQVRVK